MNPYFIIVLIIVVILAVALAPKPPEQPPSSLEDIDVPTVKRGKPIAKIFGTLNLKGPTIVSFSDLGYKAVRTKGGK